MKLWEYMTLCPDSDAGYSTLMQDVGVDGWEAVCAWKDGDHNIVLFKREMSSTVAICADVGLIATDLDSIA